MSNININRRVVLNNNSFIEQSFGNVIQLIDGTIVGNEFIDKSGNGYNLDIINNDIESGFGFPYKSAATIAQKASNFGIIPDPNNFWYTSGGTPNQIPVVSLFQNIDYANTTFTKHENQITSPNGEEWQEPYVSRIVTYSAALTGVNLTNASTYFGVPTEVTSNVYWVDGVNGNDTTGDGSKALPWKTIGKANTGTSNKTIYVKTAAYSETATVAMLNGQTWNFIGYCPFTTSASVAWSCNGTTGATLNRAVITPASGGRALYFISGNNNSAISCKLNVNGTSSKNFQILAGTGNMIKYCLLNNTVNTPSVDVRAVGMTIYGCYFSGTQTGVSEIVSFNTTAITGNIDFFYNKCANGLVANHGFFLFNVAATNYNIKYNDFKTTGGTNFSYHLNTSSLTGGYNWYYNRFRPTTLDGGVFIIAAANALTVDIQYNYIYITSSLTNGIINIIGQATPKVNYNYIYTSVQNNAIWLSSQTAKGAAEIKYNMIHQPLDGGSITLGNDTNNTWDNGHNGSQIIGNAIYGVWYYDPSEATNSGHGIAVFNCIDVHVRYNYVNGANHLVVYKASDRATAMANTDAVCAYNIGINNDGSLFPKTMSGIKFYNNLTYADNDNIIERAGGIYVLASPGAATDNHFKNNIFIDKTSYSAGRVVLEVAQVGSLSGFVCNNNVIYSQNNKIADIGGTEYTFAQWQALGYDANSLNQDVTFESISDEQWWPQAPILSAENLGASYDYGLDITTNYTNLIPYIINKQQTISWQNGPFIK